MKKNIITDLPDPQPEAGDSAKAKQNSIQVLVRASAIMRVLSDHKEGLSLAAIAKEVGLPRSTVQRLIHTLEKENLVESLGGSGGFRLGPMLGRLINRTQTDVIDVVRPGLGEISRAVNETVILSHLSGIYSSTIEQVVAENVMRIVLPLGEGPVPGYKLAYGLAMLSRYGKEKLADLLEAYKTQIDNDGRDPDQLLKEITDAREQDVFILEYKEKPYNGICMISVPVNTYMGIYAISIITPNNRFYDRIDEFSAKLTEIKRLIESKIGI